MIVTDSTIEYAFQSTLPLRGATRAGADTIAMPVFQSTLPLRGATHIKDPLRLALRISIHAPLAGSDGSQ